MTILLITCDERGNKHQFSFGCSRLEVGFEMINVLVEQGEKLLQAQLNDQSGNMLLPVDAFDGASCLAPIKKLQKEWRSLLKKPLKPALTTVRKLQQEQINLTQKRLGNWEKKQESYTNLVTFLEKALQKAPHGGLLNHYQSLLKSTQRRLTLAQITCQLLSNRLSELREAN
ncbi:hypothetical protein ACFQ4C_00405 [Larkinella insperata]|uniref:Uncharacterized protein n=1 Tax=Larkinella insperata TaxID=332158 RepID=A0ABW3QD61_9BACT|nr:hypothetical protein [Larkinella insperata]